MERPDDKVYGYIYVTTNLKNGKRYLGQHASKKFDPDYLGSGKLLEKAIKKYRTHSFSIQIVDWAYSKYELDQKEIQWIDLLSCVQDDNWYNLLYGGQGVKSGKFNPFYGKHCSEEHKQRIRENMHPKSGKDHHMFGNHEKYAGKNNPMYGRRGRLAPMYGKSPSEKTRQKMRNAHADVSANKNPQPRALVQVSYKCQLINKVDQRGAVRVQFGFDEEAIRKCCKHKKPSYKGFQWLYAEEYDPNNPPIFDIEKEKQRILKIQQERNERLRYYNKLFSGQAPLIT